VSSPQALAWRINEHLARWAMHKFKRFRGKYAKAMAWLQKIYQHQPGLFAHRLTKASTQRRSGCLAPRTGVLRGCSAGWRPLP
jgi:hypothetical protein